MAAVMLSKPSPVGRFTFPAPPLQSPAYADARACGGQAGTMAPGMHGAGCMFDLDAADTGAAPRHELGEAGAAADAPPPPCSQPAYDFTIRND